MQNQIRFIRNSGILFFFYRSLQFIFDKFLNFVFTFLWRFSLGSIGRASKISYNVTIMRPRQIYIGSNCKVSKGVRFLTDRDDARLLIKDNCVFGSDVLIDYTGGIEIGSDTLFSEQALIYTHDHEHHDFSIIKAKTLKIGSHVRFGARCIILSSVGVIGDGACIGAGAIVSKPVPAWSIVAGNPACVVKMISP